MEILDNNSPAQIRAYNQRLETMSPYGNEVTAILERMGYIAEDSAIYAAQRSVVHSILLASNPTRVLAGVNIAANNLYWAHMYEAPKSSDIIVGMVDNFCARCREIAPTVTNAAHTTGNSSSDRRR